MELTQGKNKRYVILILFISLFISLFVLGRNEISLKLERISDSRYDSKEIYMKFENSNIDSSTINIFQIINNKKSQIVEKGKVVNSYKSTYGRNCFYMETNGFYSNQVCYFKKNNHHMNKHNFIISYDEEQRPYLLLELVGIDSCNVYYKPN